MNQNQIPFGFAITEQVAMPGLYESMGWLGMLLLLISKISRVLKDKDQPKPPRTTDFLDILGSVLIAVFCFHVGNLPNAVLNSCWFGFSVWGLWNSLKVRPKP